MPNLFTITGNLLAETTSNFEFPKEGDTVRAIGKSTFQVGGKGVNVAKAYFKITKKKPIAIIFPAGFNGAKCVKWLENSSFCDVKAFQIKGETRIGLVCQNNRKNLQTTFLGEDVKVDSKSFQNSIEFLKKEAKKGDFIALCGSFPNWTTNFAKKLSKLARTKNLNLCVDSYGKPLECLSKEKIFLLKINKKEFLQTFKYTSLNAFNLSSVAEKIKAKHIVITDSKNKTYYYTNGETSALKTPKILKEISATGCGDVMFASLIAEITKSNNFEVALKKSVARASASAEIIETASWLIKRAKELFKQIS